MFSAKALDSLEALGESCPRQPKPCVYTYLCYHYRKPFNIVRKTRKKSIVRHNPLGTTYLNAIAIPLKLKLPPGKSSSLCHTTQYFRILDPSW